MNIRINSIVKDNDIYRIYVQGCLKKCEKCYDCLDSSSISVKPMYGGSKDDTERIKKDIALTEGITTVVLCGGEPFLQPQACIEIASWARRRGYKVVCESGYTFHEVLEWEDNRRVLLENIDILEMCPFRTDWEFGDEVLVDVQERLKNLKTEEAV